MLRGDGRLKHRQQSDKYKLLLLHSVWCQVNIKIRDHWWGSQYISGARLEEIQDKRKIVSVLNESTQDNDMQDCQFFVMCAMKFFLCTPEGGDGKSALEDNHLIWPIIANEASY